MEKSSTHANRKRSNRRRDIQHFRRPAASKRKVSKKRLVQSECEKNMGQNSNVFNSASTNISTMGKMVPKVILTRLNINDLQSYMPSAVAAAPAAESKFNDSINSQSSESGDWHLCVSTTSEEASPIQVKVKVCDKLASDQSESLLINVIISEFDNSHAK